MKFATWICIEFAEKVIDALHLGNVWEYTGVSLNGGTQQPWVFLIKIIILGCFGGYHHVRKHPPYCPWN